MPEDPFSTSILRIRLNRSLVALVPVIRDEITVACDDVLAFKHDGKTESLYMRNLLKETTTEWRIILASDIVQSVVARTMSRIIVGLPFCEFRSRWILDHSHSLFLGGRVPEWLNIAIRLGNDMTIEGAKLDLFPPFMRV